MTTALPDGLYKVEISGFGHASSGVAVLRAGRLLGGDASHYFCGAVTEEGGRVRAEIAASPHSQQDRPAFGPLTNAHLVLVGRMDASGSRLLLTGSVEEVRAVAIKVCLTPLVLDEDGRHAPLAGAC